MGHRAQSQAGPHDRVGGGRGGRSRGHSGLWELVVAAALGCGETGGGRQQDSEAEFQAANRRGSISWASGKL